MQEEKKKSTPKPVKKSTKTMEALAAVRIREEASLESKEIAIINAKQRVEVIESINGWHRVENGFIKSEYLK